LKQEDKELNSMISAFTSPISNKIFMAYDTKQKHKCLNEEKQESPLEHEDQPLKGPVFREFTIHIFQSISFLQTLEIDEQEINSRMIDLQWKKYGTRKLLIFDLDETLAHCVRHKFPSKDPDVFLNIPTPSGKLLNAGFNIRPFTKEIL